MDWKLNHLKNSQCATCSTVYNTSPNLWGGVILWEQAKGRDDSELETQFRKM